MRLKTFACASAVLAALAFSAAIDAGAQKGGLDETGPYDPVENWFKPGFDRWAQPVMSVAVDNPDRILIVAGREYQGRAGMAAIGRSGEMLKENPIRSRAEIPATDTTPKHNILVLNGDGRVIEEWTQWDSLLGSAHSVKISPYDPERHVWIADVDNNQVFKFTNDGKKLVLTLGEKGVGGSDPKHFNGPANINFLPDGSFFVADGYRNTRAVKFDKNGNYLTEWGKKGTGPGEFTTVHDVAVDDRGRVYVSDRGGNRVEVFDANGKFLEEWDVRGAAQLAITKDQSMWVVSAGGNRLAKFDLTGRLLTYWGSPGTFVGGLTNPHGIDVDPAGNLYVADSWSNRLLKFKPKPGADRKRLFQR